MEKRIDNIKYAHILWLTKRIKELKEKIARYKLTHIFLIVLLSGCAASKSIPTLSIPTFISNYMLTEDECVLQAFVKEDPVFEKEKIYSSLLTFRKLAPKGTIHYFFWYIEKTYLRDMKNEWWIRRTKNRILANYRYYKKTNERLLETPTDPIELLRKALLNEK